MKEIGEPGYLNQNCWLVKTLSYPPAKRCLYCEMKFRDCPFFQYLLATLFLVIFFFLLTFFIEPKISKTALAILFFSILIYGNFFTQSTEKLIKTSFLQRKIAKEFEKITQQLKKEVGEKEKAEKEAQSQSQILQERTKELENWRKALMNILEDVIEERERVREEQNKTLAIFTNFADGLLFFDENNNLFLINPQAEQMLQVVENEVIGKSVAELESIPNLKPILEILGREIKEVFRKEVKIKEDFVIEVTSVSVKRARQKIGTLVILHDVTREKEIERMKTEFVSISAHQLRTPLSAIKWTLRLLLDGDLGEITPEQKEFLEKAYISNERMIMLINDLLNVTRIEEGRFLSNLVPGNIEEIVESVFSSYQEIAKRKNIALTLKMPKEKLPQLMLDGEKMKLAIENLVDNAIRYTLPGGKVEISLEYNDQTKEILFKIKDTGIGIPKDQQKRIFQRFFRGKNAIQVETQGSGLGLFITKNIIESHQGKIWFESEEGKGTTFYFTLPTIEKQNFKTS